jgi:hypothetical protein
LYRKKDLYFEAILPTLHPLAVYARPRMLSLPGIGLALVLLMALKDNLLVGVHNQMSPVVS